MSLARHKFKPRIRKSTLYGQSVIEIVLAIGLASMVMAALIILGSASLRTATSSARRAEATKLANSGVEAVRFIRDLHGFYDTQTFNELPKCYEVSGNNITYTEGCNDITEGDEWIPVTLSGSSSDGIFQRKIYVQKYPTNLTPADDYEMVLVTSIVRWPESPGGRIGNEDGMRSVVVSTVLSAW